MVIGRGEEAMITLENNVLEVRRPDVHPAAHVQLEFQRTLRIPDDAKVHALPAGLGRFPLRHVEDFANALDETTLRRGGVMMPMHRSEAMWINFERGDRGSSSPPYPFAIKIAAGKVNALTGGAWSPVLSAEEQDYVVIPAQPWIDGFAVSKGIIRQFVAERLGDGFSAEEQLTRKAQFGGLQIIAFPMKPESYLEIVLEHEKAERARHMMAELTQRLAGYSRFVDEAHSAMRDGLAHLDELKGILWRSREVVNTERMHDAEGLLHDLEGLLSDWNHGVSELARLSPSDLRGHDEWQELAAIAEQTHLGAEPMGLGGGGRMRQEVFCDPYGVDAWDQSAGSRCFVHLVDASQWAEIAGGPAPTAPPSREDYEKSGLLWFDYYAPGETAISGSKVLAGMKSWASVYAEEQGTSADSARPTIQLGSAPRPSNAVSEVRDDV